MFLLNDGCQPHAYLSGLPGKKFIRHALFFLMEIGVHIRISVTVLPKEHIQVKGQVRGIFQPHFFPVCLLCGHLRPLCLLFFRGRDWLLDRQDFPGNADKLLRVLKLLPVFLHKVCGKVSKIFFAKPAEKELPRKNVIDIALVITEGTVQRQSHELAFLITDHGNRVIVRVNSLNVPADSGLQCLQTFANIHRIGNFPMLHH